MNTGTMCCSWVLLVALSLPCFVGSVHSLLDSGPAHSSVTDQGGSQQYHTSLTDLTGKKQEDMVGLNMKDFEPTEEPEMLPTPLPLQGRQPVVPGSSILDEPSSRGKVVPEDESKDCDEETLNKHQNEEVDLLELTKPAKDSVSKDIGTIRESAVAAAEDSQGASDQKTLVEPEENVKKTVPRKGVEKFPEEKGPSSVPRKGVLTSLPELDVENPPSVPRKGVENGPGGQSVPRKGVPSVVPKKGVGKGPEPQEVVGTNPKSTSVPRKGVESQSVPRKGVETEPSSSIPKTGVGKEPEISHAESSELFRSDEGTTHTLVGNATQVEGNSTLHINSSHTTAPITVNLTQSSSLQAGKGMSADISLVEPHLNETGVLKNRTHNKPPTSDEAFLKSPYGDSNVGGNSFSLQIFGIVLLCVILIGGIIGYERIRDVWMRRHYARVDFLVDGMYEK